MTHGTRYGYKRARCRCESCRRWHRLDTQSQKRRRGGRQPRHHGSASTYENWACRCEPCTSAKSLKNAEDRTP